jgi:hypothetical protein
MRPCVTIFKDDYGRVLLHRCTLGKALGIAPPEECDVP